MNATVIVHWPGKDTAACALHAEQLDKLALHMGFALSISPVEGEVECANCLNESIGKLQRLAAEAIHPTSPSPGHAEDCPCHRCRTYRGEHP